RKVSLACNSGAINRIDRLTAANYGMPINKNLCKNKIVQIDDASVMLHAASLFTQGDGRRWSIKDMIKVMMDVAKTSLQMLGRDLFKQLTKSQ
ncbi:EcoRI family type II restriction endonuclease, partial [uncultured Fibrobacter sp.]